MRKIVLLLVFIFISSVVYALDVVCPMVTSVSQEKESFINKISGLNYSSKKVIEKIIEKELHDEFKSSVKANLSIFNLESLKNGEFKTLKLKSKQIKYKSFSISEFNAQTICSYNKIVYENNKLYYANDIPFMFNAVIRNDDISNAINSDEFKKYLEKNPVKINGKPMLNIYNPEITIENDKLNFIVPVKAPIFSLKLRFKSGVSVKDNTLILSDISNSVLDNIINTNIFSYFSDIVNPFKYEIDVINGKYCKVYITNAQISDNIIKVEGIFVINKNYTEKNE